MEQEDASITRTTTEAVQDAEEEVMETRTSKRMSSPSQEELVIRRRYLYLPFFL